VVLAGWLNNAASISLFFPTCQDPLKLYPLPNCTQHGTEAEANAEDEQTRRIIIGIGQRRIAFDFTTRITHLPPNTGDQPAAVLPLQTHRTGDPTLTPNRSGLRKSSRGKLQRKKLTDPKAVILHRLHAAE